MLWPPARGEGWLARYGGKISSEWEFPKLLQIVEEAPELYDAMDSFVEAADWIVWQLTGEPSRNSCTAGYKAIWSKEAGYPSEAFFGELHPKLRYVIREKYACPVTPLGRRAGGLSKAGRGLGPGWWRGRRSAWAMWTPMSASRP